MAVQNQWLLDLIADFNCTGRIHNMAQAGIIHGRGAVTVKIRKTPGQQRRVEIGYSRLRDVEECNLTNLRLKRILVEEIKRYDINQFAVVLVIYYMPDGRSEIIATLMKLPTIDQN